MTQVALNVPDHLGSKVSAEALAVRIATYWRERGAAIEVWAQHDADRSSGPMLFVVRSNLVRGLPPREART